MILVHTEFIAKIIQVGQKNEKKAAIRAPDGCFFWVWLKWHRHRIA
jgi:hypothetical protein